MKARAALGAAALGVAALAAWQAAPALQNVAASAEPTPTDSPAFKPVAVAVAPPKVASVARVTPMEQRVATIGLLNKRNGLWRDFTMKPGDAVRVGDVVLRLKACEKTAPWEQEKLTGAFVQVIVNGADKKWRKVFSGWLYKESPSLNVVEHPVYDVWTRNCEMRFPDTGPETVVIRGGGTESSDSPSRSKAKKSPSRPVESSADDNNDT